MLFVLLAALACAGTWAASQVRSIRDRSEVAKMTENMKTVCVGRYLIDVPARADISLSRERLAGFEIETREEGEAEFQARIEAREGELRANGAAPADEGGMEEARVLRIPGMTGRSFVFGRSRHYLMDGERRIDIESVSVEAHAHIEGLSIQLSSRGSNASRAAAAEALLAQLRLRADDEIPAVPGFCIARAIFVEPLPPHKTEHIAMSLGLPGHPDMGLVFLSIPGGASDDGLLARTAAVDAGSSAEELLRVAKLREGRRKINGIEGEEVLEKVRELNFTTGYAFNWEVRGVEDDPLQPYLSLELQTGTNERPGGKPVDSSLHEDAVLALWEVISSSIRMRPNGPPPPSAPPPEPEGPKLGAVASAGEVCPQSGWWQCREGGPGIDVHGGQVQYIRRGERMPQALLLPRQTLWQKVRGIQPSMESPRLTSWTLVDKRMRPRSPAGVALALAQPGVPAAGAPVEPLIAVPVGVYVRTAETCPASGWWRCEEAHALDGTRWFARGSLLPPATFQVPSGLFGKSAGPDVIQRRSVWQLMRQVEAADVTVATPVPDSGLSLDNGPRLV